MFKRFVRLPGAALAALLVTIPCAAFAQDNAAAYRDVETKYIFGFTEGSGVGLEGEREVYLANIVARFGKRDGRYSAAENKFEYEFTPNQYMQVELGPMASWHNIHDVPDFDNRNQLAFSGFFGEIRYMLIDRTSLQPFALTISAEPEWHRIDETRGTRVTNFGLELALNADLELIRNRLYLGGNLLYEPEATHDPDNIGAGWEKESTGGISGALSYQVAPGVLVGAEVWYLRHYDGSFFNNFTGDAVFVGPTLYAKLTRKMFMKAAWNTQAWGREIDNPEVSLNLAEFSRQRATLKVAIEF